MNKKLLAVAVAGALAAPGLALAQSSVTISGVFKISLDQVRISSPAAARAGQNTSETRVADDSSRIIFNITEDLGGGLAAIGQLDVRVPLDTGGGPVTPVGGAIGAASFLGNGNTWVGLRSKSLGSLTLGRNDLHYFGRESNLTVRSTLKADSISLLAFMQDGTAIAGATRTQNVVKYTTPDFSGFSAIVAYSSNPLAAQENDLALSTTVTATSGNAQRKGNAWNIAPTYEAQNWTIGWSHWDAKPDGGGATLGGSTADQKADRFFGSYRWGGFHVGFAWDRSKLIASTNGSPIANVTGLLTVTPGTTLGNRTAWSLPIEYKWGNHSVMAHYTKARDDKATTDQDGAKMFAIGYAYDLSKRTSLSLAWLKITNDIGAQYNPFTTAGALGNTGSAVNAGEDPRILAATVRHAF